MYNDAYSCSDQATGCTLDQLPPAMAYVPRQVWRKVYPIDKGLMRGTIFAELDLPFLGKAGAHHGV